MNRLALALICILAIPLMVVLGICSWAGVDPFVERARHWEGR